MKVQPLIGHSKRILAHYRKSGLEYFDSVHALELLLQFGTDQQHSLVLAHTLIQRFGGLRQVLEAPIEEIEHVPGVDQRLAALISLPTALYRFSQKHGLKQTTEFKTISAYADYLTNYFIGYRNEAIFILCLDAENGLICCRKIIEGSNNSVHVPIRKIIEIALCVNAASIILAHNHPCGNLKFSPEDIIITKKIAILLDGIDVTLTDHILVADGHYISMLRQGYHKPEIEKSLYY